MFGQLSNNMNKEQKAFKKAMKSRKRSAVKRTLLRIERNLARTKLSQSKKEFLIEKKKTASKNIENRLERISQLKKTLDVPEFEFVTLEKLETRLRNQNSAQATK